MNHSGLILDLYDDITGETLRAYYPSQESIPAFIKNAEVVDETRRSQLPDDVFALVLVEDGSAMRKFACVDAGNTALSVLYFLKHAHKLNDETREMVANNLKTACAWYGLEFPEEQMKTAGLLSLVGKRVAANPLGSAMTAMTLPGQISGTKGAISHNLQAVHQGEAAAGGAAGGLGVMGKHGEFSGTYGAPLSVNPKKEEANVAKTIKQAWVPGFLKKKHDQAMREFVNSPGFDQWRDSQVPQGKMIREEAPKKTPQIMQPLAASTCESVHCAGKKEAQYYAMSSKTMYPLDNYNQVKQAMAYFTLYGEQFTPQDRHEYCVNLTKRASDLRIPIEDNVAEYGSEKVASIGELEEAFYCRRCLMHDERDIHRLDKLASACTSLNPQELCDALTMLDQATGLDHYYGSHVPDPYISVFSKVAESSFTDMIGNQVVNQEQLEGLASHGLSLIRETFGEDLASEFRTDPIGIYKSLPLEQKKMIIQMANAG